MHAQAGISCAWGNVVVYEVLPRHDFCWLKTIFKTPQAVRKYSRVNFSQRDHSVLPLPFTIHARPHSKHDMYDSCAVQLLLARPATHRYCCHGCASARFADTSTECRMQQPRLTWPALKLKQCSILSFAGCRNRARGDKEQKLISAEHTCAWRDNMIAHLCCHRAVRCHLTTSEASRD